MTPKTKKLREVTVDEVTGTRFQLQSYWFGALWCPAVLKSKDGTYQIRVGTKTRTATGTTCKFEYFELDADGVIQASPRGWASVYNRKVRVTDVAAAAERMSEPDESAHRI